jgi:hypothetical protein
VLGSDEETFSLEGSPKYQESNLSSSATATDDGGDGGDQYRIEPSSGGPQFIGEKHKLNMLHMCTLFFHTWLIMHFLYQERHTLLTSHRIQIMVHHHLKGLPWQHPLDDGVGEGVGAERLVLDLLRGRGRLIGGDHDIGEEGSEQTIVTL